MIPKNIPIKCILLAMRDIDTQGIPRRRRSYRYDLLMDGKRYPPKLVISLAVKHASGRELRSGFNAVEAKNYLARMNLTIVEKQGKREYVRGQVVNEDMESTYPEGMKKYRIHRMLERDTKITRLAKKRRLHEFGELRCDVCNFSFYRMYGDVGAGFIEAHHTIPVSEKSGKHRTKISEIALVCSNCHRMLHRAGSSMTLGKLREIVKSIALTSSLP